MGFTPRAPAVVHILKIDIFLYNYAYAVSRPHRDLPGYVRIIRIHGPFLFGATDKLHVVYDNMDSLPEIVILRLRNMTAIDATGLRALEELAEAMRRSGRCLILCGARHQPARLIARADFHRHVGDENICVHLHDALVRAAHVHGERRDAEVSA